jgi:hypothetical protein
MSSRPTRKAASKKINYADIDKEWIDDPDFQNSKESQSKRTDEQHDAVNTTTAITTTNNNTDTSFDLNETVVNEKVRTFRITIFLCTFD